MATILIEAKPLSLGNFHLYLVYQDDLGEEYVIRGAAGGSIFDALGKIVLQINIPLNSSYDEREDDDGPLSPEDRSSTPIDLGGRSAEDVWNIMVQHAHNIHNAGIDYDIIPETATSNSVVASILDAVGIDLADNMPGSIEMDDTPGAENLLDVSGTLEGGDSDDIIHGNTGTDELIGGSGTDTYTFSDLSTIGQDTIIDSDNNGKIMLEGIELSATAQIAIDENNNILENTWLIEHNDKQYYLTRVNSYNQQDASGNNLLMIPFGASDNSNSITIENFDFESGGYGISFEEEIVSGEFQVNTYTVNNQFSPKTTSLSNGNFIITWEGYEQDNLNNQAIYAQIFNASGSKIGNEFLISTYSTSYRSFADITSLLFEAEICLM